MVVNAVKVTGQTYTGHNAGDTMRYLSTVHLKDSRIFRKSRGRSVLGAIALLVSSLALVQEGGVTAGAATNTSIVSWNWSVRPPAGLNAVDIDAGAYHALGLKEDGTVVGWGSNEFGEATPPSGLNNVVEISASTQYSAALKSDGTVVTWGRNDFGQLTIPAGLNNVVAIATGARHGLALRLDGTVVPFGQPGNFAGTPPAGLTDVVAISAAGFQSLALKSDGTVVAWGSNNSGQLNIPAGLNNVVAISAGGVQNAALKADGTVVVWGSNQYGQTDVPAGLTNVVALSSGDGHILALKSDGTIVAWGISSSGQLNVPPGLSNVIDIAAGDFISMALVGPSDSTPPVITAPATGTVGDNGWYTSVVGVSWGVTDAESPVTSTSGCEPVNIVADTTVTTFTCTATSGGGTSSGSITIKRDATAPSLAPSVSPNPVLINGTSTAYAGASDATSGIVQQGCTEPTTLIVGPAAVSCNARDAAGNTSEISVSFKVIYGWSGFFAPVDNGILNTVKAGSAVPLKWRLTDATGAPILDLSTVNLTVGSLSCTLNQPADDIEEYVSGASGLQNLGDGYYQLNWKTPKEYVDSCKRLNLDIGEGITHTADFQFKK